MKDKPTTFSLNLSISTEDNSRVYFKCDGGRFEFAYTFKMNTNTLYKLTFACKPHIVIDKVQIEDKVLPVNADTRDLNRSIYKCVWKSDNVTTTKAKDRKSLTITLSVRDIGEVQTSLQCKFYKNRNHHSRWGTQVNSIQLDCSTDVDLGTVKVYKQSIL